MMTLAFIDFNSWSKIAQKMLFIKIYPKAKKEKSRIIFLIKSKI
jgi:hypothetical protein